MDEDYLSWLLLIPGIGRRRAKALAKRFPSIQDLRSASVEKIAAVDGIGGVLAERVRDFAETAAPGTDRLYRSGHGLFLCPACGALIAEDAADCPICGTAFDGEEAGIEEPAREGQAPRGIPQDRLEGHGQALNLCPDCGAFVGEGVTACPTCGVSFEGEAVSEPGLPGPEVGSAREPPGSGLFLCSGCGALVGADTTVCPRCGTTLEGEEGDEPASAKASGELPPEAIASGGTLFVCTNCGAFLGAHDTKCGTCGAVLEEGAVSEGTPLARAEPSDSLPICPSCGAFVPSTANRCGICGHGLGAPVSEPPTPKPTEEIGITRDFAERWRRVAEEKAGLTPERRLRDELEQYDQLIAADPTLERAWLNKAGILLRLGRVREAVSCYERLADLHPRKDEEYRLQVLSVLKIQGDMSLLPRRWSAIAATEPARELVTAPVEPKPAPTTDRPALETPVGGATRVVEALAFYDRLLRTDPSLAVAWQTKAELLDALGRTTEAAESRERAESLSRGPERGRRTIPPRTAARQEGRVNGVGQTNGRINGVGRINGTGRINGRGRINGVNRLNAVGSVNGRGRTIETGEGAGRTNGLRSGLMSGMPPSDGMVNGLVNGNGMTNGRRGRWTPPRPGPSGSWNRSVVGIAAAVLLLLMMPILATLMSQSPPPGGIAIDGQFGDWAQVPMYSDATDDQIANFDVNLQGYRVLAADGFLLLQSQVEGRLFEGTSAGSDSLFVFVDEDGDNATGFQVGALGAERAFEVYGWDRVLRGTATWVYDAAKAGTSSDDWHSLASQVSGTAAKGTFGTRDAVELRFEVGPRYALDRARIWVHLQDGIGNRDGADTIVGTGLGALAVTQTTIAPAVVSGSSVPFLAFRIAAYGGPIDVGSVTIQKEGSILDGSVTGSLYLDADGDGVLNGSDPLVGTRAFAPNASFPLGVTVVPPESLAYILSADLLAPNPNASIGFRVVAVSPTAGPSVPVTLAGAALTNAYVAGPPGNVTVDGAFADWDRFALPVDPDEDVRYPSNNGTANENVDLRSYGASLGEDVAVHLRVDGRILGGVDVPNVRARALPPPRTIDSDLDTVPDDVESLLGAILPYDFNNDNVSDEAQSPDVDQDGTPDHNRCTEADCSAYTDYLLEATVPAWYPSVYAGQTVRRYIGPISLSPQRGVDTAVAYVDRDNRTDTGLIMYEDGIAFGADFVYQAVGRAGAVLSSGLFAYNASRSIPWERITDAPTAIDAYRLEASIDRGLLNLTANHTFVFSMTDWRFGVDTGVGGPGLRGTRGPEMRAASVGGGEPTPFDIVGNQRFYLRNTNHATETACTTNKVASMTQGAGPTASVAVGAGQSACWYVDATTGMTITAGDWEALLDVLVAHGLAVYGQSGVGTPRYRQWSGAFGAEGTTPAVPGTEQWVVVAPSPTSPEMIVGILSDNNRLYVQTWNGAAWTPNWDVSVGGSSSRRRFDIAFEGQTADALVVFGDATNQLKYRRRVAGAWGGTLNAGTPLADFPQWIRAAPRPTNDDVFIGVATNAQSLHAMRWDGTANTFGNQVQMSGTVSTDVREPFDIAFERASGDAFMLWGSEVLELRSREFTGAWQPESVAYSLPDDARWVVADYDPQATSSSFAVGMVLDNGNFEFGGWDGTQWVARPAPIPARNDNQRGIDVAFERNTGRAFYVFNQNANPQQLAWRTWTPAGGFSPVAVLPGTSANLQFVQLRSSPHRNEIMAQYSNNAADLFHRHWSGTAWSAQGAALETSLSADSVREAFMFGWTRVVEYDVHFEIWNLTTNTVMEVVGSCLDLRTYGNDTQCLVPGVAQKTIGPTEVVRLRIAHSSLGGTFLLQFDDAVSSGDSRITLPIAIPEFETLVLPIALSLVLFAVQRRRRRPGVTWEEPRQSTRNDR